MTDSYRSSVEDTLKHPAFPGAVWNLEPTSSGKTRVGHDRGGPLQIAWEMHGSGPIKLCLIMGLACVMTTWQRQTLYFGHDRADRFSVLVLDNRGMGLSDKPLCRYSTSEMARDVIDVLDAVGWTAIREVNVVGISLGGMIAQELACAVPERVRSLTLLSTAARLRGGEGENMPTLAESAAAVAERLCSLTPRTEENAILDMSRRVFCEKWLAAPDDSPLPSPTSTPLCRPPVSSSTKEYGRFDSNFQRFQAQELVKRRDANFTRLGYLCQGIAAVWHYKSNQQLRSMADAVGRRRIMAIHGRDDHVIDVRYGLALQKAVEPAVCHVVEGVGHAPCVESEAWFNRVLEENLEAWNQLDDEE
ncbi:hypothetical protein L249_7836 [Ophiocordyceps polyrhachis-furcata BCC 54312]|uniref:AB hydrolase-1 domain-containing protein n=1 Tax=Ophiocordyceps polyrhachis-furcata BCC 54312 TaxID=1330021 RepID=A0A367L0N3_9HYPO|nr:hypothetical protein L249_7836 [Ophiocordyceps polyrhachis-furcata BCC 54312]